MRTKRKKKKKLIVCLFFGYCVGSSVKLRFVDCNRLGAEV